VTAPKAPKTPQALDAIVDVVLAYQPKTKHNKHVWGRVCYKHPLSKHVDGYARQHWMPLSKAKITLAKLKEQGKDCFIEIADPLLNRASGKRIK
jgi:hypothetical protein